MAAQTSLDADPAVEGPDLRPPALDRAAAVLAFVMSSYHLLALVSGWAGAFRHRLVHLLLALPLIFLVYTRNASHRSAARVMVRVGFLVVLALVSVGYLVWNYEYLQTGRIPYITEPTTVDLVLGFVLMGALLWATKLTVGWILPSLGALSIVYVFVGPWMPGIFRHRGYSHGMLMDVEYLTTGGIFGTPIGVAATYIVAFMIFAAFLEQFGFARLLRDISVYAAGGSRGGPAKVAVVASALMGMLSGSSVANVVSTGSFTIPLMKRLGFRPHFAAGVEAAASSGGQLTPPVMGIVAFLMVEYTGIPYVEVIGFALFPAVLYFLGVGLMVHLEAHRQALSAAAPEDRAELRREILRRIHLVIPVVVLVLLLIQRMTPIMAVLWSILALVATATLRSSTRRGPDGFVSAMVDGSKSTAMVAAPCATAGLIIGVVGLTDLGAKFAGLIVGLAGDSLALALAATMVASIILGLGLPVAPAYILQVAFTIPALTALDVPIPVAHMFVVYFAAMSMITPPVGITAYAAAAIAQADVLRTCLAATKIGLVAFIVPYMFVISPELLLMGTATQIALSMVTAVLGVASLAVALQGYALARVGPGLRLAAFAAALALMVGGWISDLVGLAILVGLVLSQLASRRTSATADVSATASNTHAS